MGTAAVGLGIMVAGVLASSAPSAPATASACTSEPFVGTIEREAESPQGHEAVSVRGPEIDRSFAFDFGSARNTTVYLATYPLRPSELGGTVEAPAGEVLATIFLRPESGDLAPGKRLRKPKDSIAVVVDSGGGAAAATTDAKGTARITSFDDDEVCFTIDYRDDFQRVKGRVRATVP